MNNKIIGKVLIEFSELPSTHVYASELVSAKSKPVHGTVISAAFQQQGRGQIGSKWHSSANSNILCSIIIFPKDLGVEQLFYQNIVVCLSVLNTLQPFVNLPIKIKWPNDIYIENKKLGGILVQNQLSGMRCSSSIWSMGLNINEEHFPSELPNPTSLFLISQKKHDLNLIFNNLLKNLELNFYRLENKDFKKLKNDFHQNLLGLNEKMSFLIQDKKVEGIIRNVDESGRLCLEIEQNLHFFNNKEISYCC